MVKIRPAISQDVQALAKIDLACFPEQASPANAFANMISDPASTLLIATEQQQICGYILAVKQDGTTDQTIQLQANEGHVIQIAAIAVDPAMHGRQIGLRLLQDLENICNTQKTSRFVSEVALDNAASKKLFAKAGYHHQETLKNYYGENKHAQRFSKSLKL